MRKVIFIVALLLGIGATLVFGLLPNSYLNEDNHDWGHPMPWLKDKYIEEKEIGDFKFFDMFGSKFIIDHIAFIFDMIFWTIISFAIIFFFARYA